MRDKFDTWLILSISGLSIFGLFNIFGINNNLFINQLAFFILGVSLTLVFLKIGIRFFKMNSLIFFLIIIFSLFLTFFIGEEIRGSRRWINLYFFNYQPSEFLKIFFVIYLADFFSEKKKINIKKIFPNLILILVPIFLIFKQPDLGNSVVYILTYLMTLFFIGIPVGYFAKACAFFLILTPILWQLLKGYQRERIISFLNPNLDSMGISYNLVQSIITLGSGSLWGRGLGRGTQSRFAFLPENHTDFVFASLAEQFGFIGGLIIISLYCILLFRLFKKLKEQTRGSFNFLFLIGVITILSVEVIINLGMNMGILPVTGIALPLLSYGGSSIVSTLIMLGLAMSL